MNHDQNDDLMILLARTTPKERAKKRTEGLSVFLVDMREARKAGLSIRPIRTMMNHSTTEVFFTDMKVPTDNLIGEEGKGFRYILSGMNAERILIAGRVHRRRQVVHRESNQLHERAHGVRPSYRPEPGHTVPDREGLCRDAAAELMVKEATRKYEAGLDCGAEANMAKMLAADSSWEAANACIQTHGGFSFAEEYDVERKFREDAALPGRADLDQSGAVVRCRACAGHAPLILRYAHVLPKREPESSRLNRLLLAR
jgi:alkylation response protein AidB-like acyl-CoA dehydrogenase